MYDEDENFDGGFRAETDDDKGESEGELEPKEAGAINDFRFDEEMDEDPDKDH